MDPHLVAQTAIEANQVGLLTWLVIAITLFCGFIVVIVIFQNNKREERYARLVEKDLVELGTKIDIFHGVLKDKFTSIEEANRNVKTEHQAMVNSLQKMSQTMVQMCFILKMKPNDVEGGP